MSRAEYPASTVQPEEVTVTFSFQCTNAGAISLIRGGGGRISSIGAMASGVSVITLAKPYPYQLLAGFGSVSVSGGVDGGTIEIDTASYSNSAGTVSLRHVVVAGTAGNPPATCRINVTLTFLKRKALQYP